MAKVLLKGNQAIAEAAVRAGCRLYAGYPITPQNEIPEYLSSRMPEEGRIFIQSESEIAAINMIFGASAAGARCMTSSSSPGISLKQEGISYIAGAELPCVIVNIMRGGPGLGNIAGTQSDYFQSVKGGGHGDYRLIVLAPNSAQESYDLTIKAFNLADKYRNPVMVVADGYQGQMMEPVELKDAEIIETKKDWALTGADNRPQRIIKSLFLNPEDSLTKHNMHLQEKYARISEELCLFEEVMMDDADYFIVAYGTSSRVAKASLELLRSKGIKAGLIRPITLWPFPSEIISERASKARGILVVEMSAGQLVYDVENAVKGKSAVSFYGRPGGWLPTPKGIMEKIVEMIDNAA